MNGLRAWTRDALLPACAGEPGLAPPDEAGILALVAEHLLRPDAPAPARAEWVYARWKPGVAVSAGFRLCWTDGAERLVHAKVHAGDKAAHLAARARAGPAPDDPPDADALLSACAALPERRLLLSTFPHDRELPGLPRLLDLHRTRRLFAQAGVFDGRVVRAHRSRATLLRYRPESRAVLRLDLGLKASDGARSEARLAARVLPPPLTARVAAARRAAGHPRLAPRLLLAEERTGLLFEEWLDVEVRAPEDFSHAASAGAALAELHVPAQAGPAAPDVADLAGLRPLFAWHPRLAGLSAGARAPHLDAPPCWTHGDLHPDQVALARGDGSPRLLDLDRLGPGFALDDLASWIADALAVQPDRPLDDAAAPLLEAYVAAGGRRPGAPALAAAVAAGLVARAAGALRRLQVDAVDDAATYLERARELAPRGSVFP